ncbi:hypothetical protein EXIGLDRAFT_768326 [Exidia glandulosa HHB12029]|uniref:C2H2-type domain-containing protein n=1 Tax=Exidia glandulosa HHB12029 TaxID=1314781 RepID=A0A165I9W3_EXIGL|nr:hypothetical protein EXIGLDRAFT_768326 [Exidia glandulosa HHB12029]
MSEAHRCLWEGCEATCSSAKELFENLCSSHAQRRNVVDGVLICRWDKCSTKPAFWGGENKTTIDHMRTHSAYKEFFCARCGKGFALSNALSGHDRKCTSNLKQPHLEVHDNGGDEDEAGEPEAPAAVRHLSVGSEPSITEVAPPTAASKSCLWAACESKFPLADAAALGEHVCEHFARGGGECQWEDCGELFEDADLHRQHVKNVHVPKWETPFKCVHCPRQFKAKKGLLAHVGHTHQAQKSAPRTVSNKNKRPFSSDVEQDEATKRAQTRGAASVEKTDMPRRKAARLAAKAPTGSSRKQRVTPPPSAHQTPPDIWTQMRDVVEGRVDELIKNTVARKLGDSRVQSPWTAYGVYTNTRN